MSIYSYSEKINSLLQRNIIKIKIPEIIAYKGNDKVYYDDYDEKKLEKLARKNYIFNINFWNINYCDENNLSEEFKTEFFFQPPKSNIVNINKINIGILVMSISFLNTLYLTYEVEDHDKYCEFLNNLNIDRNVFAKFIIENNFCLPLTENYLSLIKRIFTNINIIDYVFNDKIIYNPNQIKSILEHFNFGSINFASQYIFDNKYLSTKDKLCYIEVLLDLYDDDIDKDNIIFLNTKNFKPYLLYYLFSLDIDYDLNNFYFIIMEKFITKNGAHEIKIVNDDKLNDKMANKSKVIKDHFQGYLMNEI
jgi:hypothetical protein